MTAHSGEHAALKLAAGYAGSVQVCSTLTSVDPNMSDCQLAVMQGSTWAMQRCYQTAEYGCMWPGKIPLAGMATIRSPGGHIQTSQVTART